MQGVAALLGNSLTLLCVARYTYLRSPAYILVASLALSDLLHGLTTGVILPFRIFTNAWPTPSGICRSTAMLEAATGFISFVMFALIAIERWNSLMAQLNKRKKWTTTWTLGLTAACWVVLLTWTIVTALNFDPGLLEKQICIGSKYLPPHYINTATVILAVSLVIVFSTYARIGCIVYSSRRSVQNSEHTDEQQRRRSNIRITKMMAMVFGVFFTLYFPMSISIATMPQTPSQWQYVRYFLAITAFDVNFWINPTIYAWRDVRFRKAFKDLTSRYFACFRAKPSNVPLNTVGTCNSTQGIATVSGNLSPRNPIIEVRPRLDCMTSH